MVYENIKDQKTVGEISHDPYLGITEIARPHGPILALTPLTNPTSTTIFKTLIAMKTRNPLIFSAHGAARKCSRYTVELLYNAALKAGAPEDCIQWITKRHPDYLHRIMRHRKLTLIIATGTRRIVKEAYVSGKPVIGIGPGNVPAYVHESADFPLAADYIVKSKTLISLILDGSVGLITSVKSSLRGVSESFDDVHHTFLIIRILIFPNIEQKT